MAKDTKKNKVKNEKKENKTFFRDFKAELKKVTWPTSKQLASKTAAVIVIVLIVAALVFALDFVFDKGYETIISKTYTAINKDNKENTNSENETLPEDAIQVEEATGNDQIVTTENPEIETGETEATAE